MSALGRIDQVGIVVRDLDASEAGMRRVLGLEPHTRTENTYRRTTYRGREIDATVGVLLYDVRGLELEFLAPRTSGNVWQDFLDERGEGLHHIRFAVDSHAAARDDLHSRGVETYQEGESMRGGGVRYAYYDSVPFLGFLLETLNPGGAP
ncbi:VOC family protein [Prauserella flavalba]|uniref:VOC domain-containing protein n=1 Tax=Prauserella flavalba TaxID=1477506 RepID=A0A318MCM1_9PSEU|nr:VOC family protein [Prauserella flavalba]PXY36629.1 hypothetical protein BA062_14770 [Prauserella flavalba]